MQDWQDHKKKDSMLAQAYAQQLEDCTLDAASASQFSLMLSALMPIEVSAQCNALQVCMP